METGISFSEKESRCRFEFSTSGKFYHISTNEDFEIIFRIDDDYSTGISILAVCTFLFQKIKVITFSLMSNHIHIVASGERSEVEKFVALYLKYLFRYFNLRGRTLDSRACIPDVREIPDIEYLRNSIVYDNRNAFVVNPNCTPMTYRWGAGKYYFNPDAKQRWRESAKKLTVAQIRELTSSRKFDDASGMIMLDGSVSPMSFCDIKSGEAIFRDDAHYFFKLSRDVESNKQFAIEIGEKVRYTDDELFSILTSLSKAKYGSGKVSLLPSNSKIELSKLLHFEYNASNKQIIRMLRLEDGIVNSLFPKRIG